MAKIKEINKNLQVKGIIDLNSHTELHIFIGGNSASVSQNSHTVNMSKVEVKAFCEAMLELLKESEL